MASTKVPPRFQKTAAGRVQLESGDLRFLSNHTGFSAGHVSRCIGGDRTPTPELKADLEALLGVKLELVDLPRSSRK